MNRHRLAEERSLAYHTRIASDLSKFPALLDTARARVASWRENASVSAPYIESWGNVLAGPIQAIINLLTDPSEHARELRQVSPFAGALPPRERWALWKSVREQWEREHGDAK